MNSVLEYFLKKRLLIIINSILILIVAIIYSFFFATKEYRSDLTFFPPVSDQNISSSLFSFAIPQQLSGMGNSVSTEQIESIFDSRYIKRKIINKFNFYKLFKFKPDNPNKFQLALKKMDKYLQLTSNEKGGIGLSQILSYTITSYHVSPDTAKQITEFTFFLLDSAIKTISIDRAHRNRLFIENQISINKKKLDSLQSEFNEFQKEHKIYDISEQLKLSLKNYAEIKAASIMDEINLSTYSKDFLQKTPEYNELNKRINIYRQKLMDFEKKDTPDILSGFEYNSNLLPKYTSFQKEIEIQNQLTLLLRRELEQAKIQESKNISNLVIVDPAYTPEYKSRPKRLLIIIMFFAIEHFFFFLLLIYHYYYTSYIKKDPKFIKIIHSLRHDNAHSDVL